jgi:hypothetical protein
MDSGASSALLGEIFGVRLLAYLCGTDHDQMAHRVEESESLPQAAEAVLERLIPLAEAAALQRAQNPGYPLSLALDMLGRYDAAAETTLANVIRRSAGVDLPDAALGSSADSDPVKAAAFRLARDAYPLLLVPSEEPWRRPLVPLFQHPARHELEANFLEDPTLARLFSDEDPGLGRRGMVFNNLGRGGSIQSVMLAETLIAAGWDRLSYTNGGRSLQDLLGAIDTNLDLVREALDGGEPRVPALVVFTGITTAQAGDVETPWGVLRSISDAERRVAPSMLEGEVSGTDPAGKSVTVSYAGELTLATDLPYSLVPRPWSDIDEPFGNAPRPSGVDALRRRIEGVQLATFLAVERPLGSWVTARLAWYWIGDPLGHGPALGWNDWRSQPGFMPYELNSDDCAALAIWATYVESHWRHEIDIAVRRVLSAAHMRNDPADRLVDAVIAWENLFGTSEGEPRLRISTAMAWLLEDDHVNRAARANEIKRLYDDRSKIVHGAPFDENLLGERANDAVALARSSLQALFRDRSDLLALRDGATRSLNLILDSRSGQRNETRDRS